MSTKDRYYGILIVAAVILSSALSFILQPLPAAIGPSSIGPGGQPPNPDLCLAPGLLDSDSDGAVDVCDVDDDGDGIPDLLDNCQFAFNPDQLDSDGDGLGDACDYDDDGDGVADIVDNCPRIANSDQTDSDHDGLGDVCDSSPHGPSIVDEVVPTSGTPSSGGGGGGGSRPDCNDNRDNDEDGLVDFPADPGCTSDNDNDETNPQCNDGEDNDGDNLTDFPADPGCSDAGDNDETNAPTQCSDGLDNDDDTFVDFPADADCTNGGDDNESPTPDTACGDGLDNDGDGLIDLNDPDCTNGDDPDEGGTDGCPAGQFRFEGACVGECPAGTVPVGNVCEDDNGNGGCTGTCPPPDDHCPASADSDGDGVCDPDDNCPDNANPEQNDIDRDGIGDACDPCPNGSGTICGETPPECPVFGPCPPNCTDIPCEGVEGNGMTGGGTIAGVAHGFTIDCDGSQQSLEVNWGQNNKFKLESLSAVSCFDTDADPGVPGVRFDTIAGRGSGTYNGASGYTIDFAFTDDGEPGDTDVGSFLILDGDGNVILQVDGSLLQGNHQVHD
ncbi:MAG TPA: thrombospondin type 3 repeat-containing protein [Candidatus Thermoplasmatota archaeon]|nr:thrombospondin type 3 repeat-containing protein [Candidatus Thermoplasmatota archaeon]